MFVRNPHRGTAPAPCRRGLPLALLALLLASCGGPAKGPESVSLPGDWKSFEGSGTATGHRQTPPMGPDRKVSTFSLSGSLLLSGERRLGEGFRIDVIGSSDSLKGGAGWSVWTDTAATRSSARSAGNASPPEPASRGPWWEGQDDGRACPGSTEFEWQFVIESEEGEFQGRITRAPGPGPPVPAAHFPGAEEFQRKGRIGP